MIQKVGSTLLIPTRRTFSLLIAASLIILLGGGTPWAVRLSVLAFAATLIAWLVDGFSIASGTRLAFLREAPDQVYLEQPQPIAWIVENRGARAAVVQLRDVPPERATLEPRILSATVPGNSRTRLSYTMIPNVRGEGTFGDLDLRVLGPLGLAWKQNRIAARQAVRCLPYLANWTAAELAARSALVRQTGSRRYRWRGTGTVFESLRDYNTEDDIRWVDWKATARAQRPISRNFESERHQQMLLLIDSSRMMATYCGHRTKFDVALEAAVLAARCAASQGDAVGLLLFSDKPLVHLPPRRDQSQVGRIMNALYDRQPQLVEPDFETALTLSARRNLRRTLMILLTDVTAVESSKRMSAYLRMLVPRHLPLIVTIADDAIQQLAIHNPRDAHEFYQVGIANELQQQREELLEFLRSSGIVVIDSPADQIATQTIQTYLDVKRRMRL